MKTAFRPLHSLLPVLCFCSLPLAASSLRCVTERGDSLPLMALNASHALKIASSVPAGRQLFSQRYPFTVCCSISDPQQQTERVWFTRRTSSQTLGNGLTLFTTLNGERSSEPGRTDSGVTVDNHAVAEGKPPRDWQRLTFSVDVEIVKTADSPQSGERSAISPTITLLEVGDDSGGPSAKLLLQGADRWLTFVAQSCRVRGSAALTVALGQVSLHDLQGAGASRGEKAFSLDLLCDRDVAGYVDVMLQLDGEPPAGLSGNGLLALTRQPLAAAGVALQILHGGSRQPVTLGKAWPVARYPLADAAISVPLIVRYYPYSTRLRAGKADATLTWTLSYL